MAETPQGSRECVNVGYGKPKFNFLLCWACPNGFEIAKARWYPIHIWHLNPLASRNDEKVWTQEFGLFWCDIWHKPKPSIFHPLFCLQVKLCISITHLSCVPNATLLLVVVPPLHHDGVWWMAKWNTCRVHCHGKARENDLHFVLHGLSQCLLEDWMPNAIIVDSV
jgi:hypothetical protein